jgi:hypothetical protein
MVGILFPLAVLLISLGLTLFLYRHFSQKD